MTAPFATVATRRLLATAFARRWNMVRLEGLRRREQRKEKEKGMRTRRTALWQRNEAAGDSGGGSGADSERRDEQRSQPRTHSTQRGAPTPHSLLPHHGGRDRFSGSKTGMGWLVATNDSHLRTATQFQHM